MKYQRILIIGPSGAGKTTYSEYISNKLHIDVIHLDHHYWLPNWTMPDLDDWKNKIIEFASKPSWIIEGNYYKTLDERLKRADLVICLHPSRIKCVLSIIERVYKTKHHKIERSDLPFGCTENKVDMNLVKWSFNYYKLYNPILQNIIKDYPNIDVKIFKSRRLAYKFIDKELLK